MSWSIWNFSKGTGLSWVDIRVWGTKGLSIRHRCIGTYGLEPSINQSVYCNWVSSVAPHIKGWTPLNSPTFLNTFHIILTNVHSRLGIVYSPKTSLDGLVVRELYEIVWIDLLYIVHNRKEWRRIFAAGRLIRSRVQISLRAWIFISSFVVCYVSKGKGRGAP